MSVRYICSWKPEVNMGIVVSHFLHDHPFTFTYFGCAGEVTGGIYICHGTQKGNRGQFWVVTFYCVRFTTSLQTHFSFSASGLLKHGPLCSTAGSWPWCFASPWDQKCCQATMDCWNWEWKYIFSSLNWFLRDSVRVTFRTLTLRNGEKVALYLLVINLTRVCKWAVLWAAKKT